MKKMVKSWSDASRGICTAFSTERNFRLEILFTVFFLLLAYYVHLPIERVAIGLVSLAGVMAAELLNTALETLCDHVHPDHHDMIAQVKHIAAAAVLVFSVATFTVLILIFLY